MLVDVTTERAGECGVNTQSHALRYTALHYSCSVLYVRMYVCMYVSPRAFARVYVCTAQDVVQCVNTRLLFVQVVCCFVSGALRWVP